MGLWVKWAELSSSSTNLTWGLTQLSQLKCWNTWASLPLTVVSQPLFSM